jgi:hypothetical protein
MNQPETILMPSKKSAAELMSLKLRSGEKDDDRRCALTQARRIARKGAYHGTAFAWPHLLTSERLIEAFILRSSEASQIGLRMRRSQSNANISGTLRHQSRKLRGEPK